MLKGRVVVNGVVSYVFRNKFDVQNFAETEYKKHLVEQIITDNDIADEYLSEKYKDKLNVIKGSYKGNLERITKEVDSTPAEQFTIKHLILDYLNNSSDYTKLIKDGDQIIDAGSVLNDFCRELNKQQVINEDSESELARYLRRLHWKREQFGKSELYKGLATYVPEFAQEVGEQQFINLNQEGMEELLQKYFKNDIILSNYHVESVGRSIPQSIRLTKSQVKRYLIKPQRLKILRGNLWESQNCLRIMKITYLLQKKLNSSFRDILIQTLMESYTLSIYLKTRIRQYIAMWEKAY